MPAKGLLGGTPLAPLLLRAARDGVQGGATTLLVMSETGSRGHQLGQATLHLIGCDFFDVVTDEPFVPKRHRDDD